MTTLSPAPRPRRRELVFGGCMWLVALGCAWGLVVILEGVAR